MVDVKDSGGDYSNMQAMVRAFAASLALAQRRAWVVRQRDPAGDTGLPGDRAPWLDLYLLSNTAQPTLGPPTFTL